MDFIVILAGFGRKNTNPKSNKNGTNSTNKNANIQKRPLNATDAGQISQKTSNLNYRLDFEWNRPITY